MNLHQIESEALALSLQERAALAQRLLLSLEDISDQEFEQLWAVESARRAAEFDKGKTNFISGEEVAKKARALPK